jgi:hypothetical protein
MSREAKDLADTVKAMRPMVPARDFEISRRFYVDLGFQPQALIPDRLVEMSLGACSFMLQAYYVRQWADNFVIHMGVTDLDLWWDHIRALDLPSRYGVNSSAPRSARPGGWSSTSSTHPGCSGEFRKVRRRAPTRPKHSQLR